MDNQIARAYEMSNNRFVTGVSTGERDGILDTDEFSKFLFQYFVNGFFTRYDSAGRCTGSKTLQFSFSLYLLFVKSKGRI